MLENENQAEQYPIADATNVAILMHRDAHFGGSFDIMLEYYQKDGKGVSSDFSIDQIYALAQMEKNMHQNLAPLLLSGPDAEKVAKVKEVYKNLRSLYEVEDPKNKYPRLIADLILSEEEVPEKEIEAIVAEKGFIVRALLELLRSEDFHDPLFPGYGSAPSYAIQCLGKIGDKRAIISLFEAIGEEDFFSEDVVIDALYGIGEPAKAFLLKVLHGRPLNLDNERAAIALVAFKDDPEVASECFKMLKDREVRKQIPLATFLALACEGLQSPSERQSFVELASDVATPKILHQDIKAIAQHWLHHQ